MEAIRFKRTLFGCRPKVLSLTLRPRGGLVGSQTPYSRATTCQRVVCFLTQKLVGGLSHLSHHFAPYRVGMCRRHLTTGLSRKPKRFEDPPQTDRYRRGGCGCIKRVHLQCSLLLISSEEGQTWSQCPEFDRQERFTEPRRLRSTLAKYY